MLHLVKDGVPGIQSLVPSGTIDTLIEQCAE